jgi:predicted nicotinamide N-methyase
MKSEDADVAITRDFRVGHASGGELIVLQFATGSGVISIALARETAAALMYDLLQELESAAKHPNAASRQPD